MPALKKTRVWPSLNFSLSSLTMSITAWAAALSFLALATAEAPMMLYLRDYLHLPSEIVPSTLKRALPRGDARPARTAAPRPGGDKPEGDRAAYRKAPGGEDKAGAAG